MYLLFVFLAAFLPKWLIWNEASAAWVTRGEELFYFLLLFLTDGFYLANNGANIGLGELSNWETYVKGF